MIKETMIKEMRYLAKRMCKLSVAMELESPYGLEGHKFHCAAVTLNTLANDWEADND